MTNEEAAYVEQLERDLLQARIEAGRRRTERDAAEKLVSDMRDVLLTMKAERDRLRAAQSDSHTARFELRRDEDTGRLYWWGAEDGWKDATEVGEDAVLTLNGANFQVGTVLRLSEPSHE